MGKSMLTIAWIIALAMLTYYFRIREQKDYNPNKEPSYQLTQNGVREVNLQRNRYNHYITDGKINGQGVTFLVDTGATDVAISGKLADRLKLERGYAAKAITANGYATVYTTKIDTIQIGNIVFHNVRATINPTMPDMEVLLGMSAIKDIEFIQKGTTLTLRQYPP